MPCIVCAQACTFISAHSCLNCFSLCDGLEGLCYLWWWRGNSNQNNGLEVYSNFLQTVHVAEFRDLESLPVSVKFVKEHYPETFLKNHAKWHKACHLKFAPLKKGGKVLGRK